MHPRNQWEARHSQGKEAMNRSLSTRGPGLSRLAVFVVLSMLGACEENGHHAKSHASAPTITTQPASTTVAAGQAATFSVSASGKGTLTYQWRKGGSSISGATASSYTTPATTSGDNGATFDVVVSNAKGSTTSAAATLTVTAAPTVTFTTQPANASVSAGSTATFLVAATCSSGSPTFQWQKSTNGGGTFTDVASATSASYTTPLLVAGDNGAQFRARVTCGSTTQTSDAATLTVTTSNGGTVALAPMAAGLSAPAHIGQAYRAAREPSGSYLFWDTFGLRRLSSDGKRITTLVGVASTVAEALDGPAATAKLGFPADIVVDGNGNAYLADVLTRTIRKVATDGTVSTIAGSPGVPGTADGTGSAARFLGFSAMAIGADGDLYVADNIGEQPTVSSRIRRVTTAGVVTTYAGGDHQGFQDGSPASALFANPAAMAVSASNDVYVADNLRIRRIVRSGNTAGSVETFAGNGTANYADGVGTAAGGLGTSSRMAVVGSTLYVGSADGRMRTIDLNTKVVATFAGSPNTGQLLVLDGTGTAATFDASSTIGAYVANPDGSLFVADNFRLRSVTPAGVVRTIGFAREVTTLAPGGSPDGVITDQAFLELGDGSSYLNARVASSGDGNAYVLDAYAWLRKITAAGVVSAVTGIPGGFTCTADGAGTVAQFVNVTAMTRDASGTSYVADGNNGAVIRKVSAAGAVSSLAGACSATGAVNGAGASARFTLIRGIAADGAGNVYVADTGNHAIRRIDVNGNVTTYAGALGEVGSTDGPATSARFNQPAGLALAGDGTLYVTELQGGRIRKITSGGTVSTVITIAGVGAPLALDSDGALYFYVEVGAPGGSGIFVLPSGSSTATQLIPGTNGANDLGANPQKVGRVLSMAILAPKQLAVVAGGQLLRTPLP